MSDKITINSLLIFLFLGCFVTISFDIYATEISLERVFVPLLCFFATVTIFTNSKSFKVLSFDLILFLVLELFFVASCILYAQNEYIFYLRTLINFTIGFILYLIFINIEFKKTTKNMFFIFIFFGLYLAIRFSVDFSKIAFVPKHELAQSGFNPNAVLNSLVVNMIIIGLFVKSNLIYKTVSLFLILLSGLQFSRQNLVASFFIFVDSLRDKKIILLLICLVAIIFSSFINLEIILYIYKGIDIISGNIESSRAIWIQQSIQNIASNPFSINFDYPIDNTALTLILMYGLIPGLIILCFIFFVFSRLAFLSVPLAMSLFTLFILNDILFEASFWFLFFCMISAKSFKKISKMSFRS